MSPSALGSWMMHDDVSADDDDGYCDDYDDVYVRAYTGWYSSHQHPEYARRVSIGWLLNCRGTWDIVSGRISLRHSVNVKKGGNLR